jgi:hypothetical protein
MHPSCTAKRLGNRRAFFFFNHRHHPTMDGYPQELVDRIIDHLHNDRPALAVSAAAYRRFLHAAHHHLFVHARLRSAARCRVFLDVLDGRPGLGAHVRYLAVDNTQDESGAVLVVLAALVPHLTSVDALSLRALDFRTADDAPWAAALTHLPVREAYVYMCTFADVYQAGRLLRCFPALEEFDFWWNEWEAREPAAALRPPVFLPLAAAESAPLQHLRVVSLGDCPAVELVAWLLQTRSAAGVRVLSFNLAELELVRACAALLAAAAGAVEQLCIDCVTFPQVLRLGMLFLVVRVSHTLTVALQRTSRRSSASWASTACGR